MEEPRDPVGVEGHQAPAGGEPELIYEAEVVGVLDDGRRAEYATVGRDAQERLGQGLAHARYFLRLLAGLVREARAAARLFAKGEVVAKELEELEKRGEARARRQSSDKNRQDLLSKRQRRSKRLLDAQDGQLRLAD